MTVAMTHDLNAADELILSELATGRNLPQNLAHTLDYSRQYVQNRLQMLQASGYVRNIGGGLYEITDKGLGELADDPRDVSGGGDDE
jgi:predicted transcriptional regulator